METKEKIKKGLMRKLFGGKHGTVMKLILFPIYIGALIMVKIAKIAMSGVSESSEISKENKMVKKYEYIDVIYFTDYGLRFLKARVDSAMKSITPDSLEAMFGFDKIYPELNTGKPYGVLYEHYPKTVNFEDEPKDYSGELPLLKLRESKDKKVDKLRYSVDMKKFKIKGGKTLSNVAYSFVNTTYMNLLRPISEHKLRNTFIIGILAGFVLGGLVFTFLIGLLS